MEQFDTDDKLIENSKNKKEKKTSSLHCFIIILCCIFALCLIFAVFKYVKKGHDDDEENLIDHSNLYIY